MMPLVLRIFLAETMIIMDMLISPCLWAILSTRALTLTAILVM